MIESLIKYYKDLLQAPYKHISENSEFIATLLSQIMIFDLLKQIEDGFNINTATGDQLTKLGALLGLDRKVKEIVEESFFGAISYHSSLEEVNLSRVLIGSQSYYQPPLPGSTWNYSSYFQYSQNLLTDTEFRTFIRMKIAVNTGNCSLKAIDDFFRTFFGGLISVREVRDMVLEYGVERGNLKNFFLYMLEKKVFPKPAGVSIGSGFVLVPPFAFSSVSYATSSSNIPENIWGSNLYENEPIGVTALYSYIEGEDYAEIT